MITFTSLGKLVVLAPLTLLLVLLCTGCSSMQVTVDHDPGYDFADLKTYAWLDEPTTRSSEPWTGNPLLTKRIRAYADEELAQHGYQRVDDPSAAQFLVGHFVTLEKKTDVTVVNDYYNYPGAPGWYQARWQYHAGGYYGPSRTYVTQYNQGSLIIDLIDARSSELFWRGVATDEVNFSRSPEQRQKQLREAIAKLFEDFPPEGQSGTTDDSMTKPGP